MATCEVLLSAPPVLLDTQIYYLSEQVPVFEVLGFDCQADPLQLLEQVAIPSSLHFDGVLHFDSKHRSKP